MNEEIEDIEILALFKDESTKEKGFKLLLKKYQKRIYWHIRKILVSHDDTDDVTQNTFVKVYYSLDGFREESKLYTWIYRIATNESLSFIKKKKESLYADWDSVEFALSESLVGDTYFDGNQIQLKLQQALLTLPEKQRIVFNMKYFDQIKYEDMSEILDTSVGALKASYHHAVKKIEKYFGLN
jgi:RNA polymerase sigma factor (sigma-70 family)